MLMGLFPEGEGVLHLCNLGTASDCERHGTGMSPNNQMLPIASRFRRYARTRRLCARKHLATVRTRKHPEIEWFFATTSKEDTTLGNPLGLMPHFRFGDPGEETIRANS